jgi:hypothetical protein
MAFQGKERDQRHQAYRDQQTGHDAAHEQILDGHAGRHAVEDHHRAWRNDGADDGGGCGDGRAEPDVVALIGHGLDFDRAETGRVRDGGAGHAGKQRGAEHVYVAQAARQASDELLAKRKIYRVMPRSFQ